MDFSHRIVCVHACVCVYHCVYMYTRLRYIRFQINSSGIHLRDSNFLSTIHVVHGALWLSAFFWPFSILNCVNISNKLAKHSGCRHFITYWNLFNSSSHKMFRCPFELRVFSLDSCFNFNNHESKAIKSNKTSERLRFHVILCLFFSPVLEYIVNMIINI